MHTTPLRAGIHTSYVPWWGWPLELLHRVLFGHVVLKPLPPAEGPPEYKMCRGWHPLLCKWWVRWRVNPVGSTVALGGLSDVDVDRLLISRASLIDRAPVSPAWRRRWWVRNVQVATIAQVVGPDSAHAAVPVYARRPYWWAWPLELLWRVHPLLSFYVPIWVISGVIGFLIARFGGW